MPEGIIYNDPAFASDRASVKPLSTDEVKKLVLKLNVMAYTGRMSEEDKTLLQRLVWNYENLQHYHSYTGGKNAV